MASSELNENDETVLTMSEEEVKAIWILLGKLPRNSLLEKGLSEAQADMISQIWHSLH